MATNKKPTTKVSTTKVTRSSGNIFADIGLANASEHELKARIVLTLDRTIRAMGLTQSAAAKRIGIAQPDLSKIIRGNFSGFSLERLLGAVTKLGNDVEIKIKTRRSAQAGHEGRMRLVTT
jgi:predicted XRE-type DNA-binding protein